jgi:hypothetical protein
MPRLHLHLPRAAHLWAGYGLAARGLGFGHAWACQRRCASQRGQLYTLRAAAAVVYAAAAPWTAPLLLAAHLPYLEARYRKMSGAFVLYAGDGVPDALLPLIDVGARATGRRLVLLDGDRRL